MSVNRRAKPFWRSLEFTLPVLVAALLLLPYLGQLDLWAPDEPRYAQISEEIRALEHGPRGLALLHLNGQPYTQKPPLYFWLAAGFGSLNGHVDHWSARLPSALAGIAIIGLTAALAGTSTHMQELGWWHLYFFWAFFVFLIKLDAFKLMFC